MILWMEAVTDRSQSDVDRVISLRNKGWVNFSDDEKTEWLNGLKGAINTSDLNRIENNIQLLSDVLELSLTTYYGNVPDIPNVTYFDTMISNVESIRSAYCIHEDTPETPTEQINKYTKINDIEKILDDVHSILLNNFNYYAGDEIYAGDETGLLL